MGRKPQTIEKAIEKHVGKEPDPNACWIWRGPIQKRQPPYLPYPVVTLRGIRIPARRAIYEALVEAVPSCVKLKPGCTSEMCVNPRHAINPLATLNAMREPERPTIEAAPPSEADLRDLLATLPRDQQNPAYIRSMNFGFDEDVIAAVFPGD